MSVWICLLRGVNVGGHNKLPMADFRALLLGQGHRGVASYIQSGNAVFESDLGADVLGDMIAEGVEGQFGFRPDVMMLSLGAMETALSRNPFPQAMATPQTLHLFFLNQAVQDVDQVHLKKLATNGEKFVLDGKIFYLFTPNGFGKSKLAGKIATVFKTPMTARNLRTCNKIVELAHAI